MNSTTWGFGSSADTFTEEGFFPKSYGNNNTPFNAGSDNITTYVRGSTPGSIRRVSIPRAAVNPVKRTSQHTNHYGAAAEGGTLIPNKVYQGSGGYTYVPREDWSIFYEGPKGQTGVRWAQTGEWWAIMKELGATKIGKASSSSGSKIDVGGTISSITDSFLKGLTVFKSTPTTTTVVAPTTGAGTGAGAGAGAGGGFPLWVIPVGVVAVLGVGVAVSMARSKKK